MQLSQDGPLYILRGDRLLFPKTIAFLSLKIDVAVTSSADPDEKLRYAAFHLGLHCFENNPFILFQSTKG